MLARSFARSLTAQRSSQTILRSSSAVSGLKRYSSVSDVKKPLLTLDNINPRVKSAQYAVRGELAVKSEVLRRETTEKTPEEHGLPFNTVISANIGNPQQLDQKPITFFRQVLALLENPDMLEWEGNAEKEKAVKLLYPEDAIERARQLLKDVGSVGAYSQSQGAFAIRKNVAKFLEERDGFPADPEAIFLTAGASSGVNSLLTTICANSNSGVLIPIPQYPLYTATLALLGATPVPYYLDEATAWSTNVKSIEDALVKAKAVGTDVRCIAVINPGNPTGGSLSKESIEAVLRLAGEHRLVVMADEVYQTNVFVGEFISFKKVLRELQAAEPGQHDHIELVSLHSVSKGMVGECGHRGGYFELVGFTPEVRAQIYKLISIFLCPPVIGQCLVDLMVQPPKPGQPSYDLYKSEYDGIYNRLKTRAYALYDAFKTMDGVHCQEPQGAMYLFPTITVPEKAAAKALSLGKQPDEYYCMRMLEATGVCVVPGSGFGQKAGEWHFRTTFLAPGTDWIGRVVKFHQGFMEEFK